MTSTELPLDSFGTDGTIPPGPYWQRRVAIRYYIWSGNQVILELDNPSTVTEINIYGLGKQLARRFPTKTDSLHVLVTDYHGSLRSDVPFGSGYNTDLIEYYPYGELLMQSGTNLTNREFIGKEYDKVKELDFGPRYYNSTAGHFLSPDPILSAPSAYAYTDGNPVMQYDPTGLDHAPLEIFWPRTVTMDPPNSDCWDEDPFKTRDFLSDYTGGNSTPTTVQGTPPGLNIGLAPAPPDMTGMPGYNMNTLPQIKGGDTWCRGFNSSGNVSYGGSSGGKGGGGGGGGAVGIGIFGLVKMAVTMEGKAAGWQRNDLGIAFQRTASYRAMWRATYGKMARGLGKFGKGLGLLGIGINSYSILTSGANRSNVTALAFGCAAFIPGVGWVISLSYFVVNTTLEVTTGNDVGYYIGEFLENSPGRRTIPRGFMGEARGL